MKWYTSLRCCLNEHWFWWIILVCEKTWNSLMWFIPFWERCKLHQLIFEEALYPWRVYARLFSIKCKENATGTDFMFTSHISLKCCTISKQHHIWVVVISHGKAYLKGSDHQYNNKQRESIKHTHCLYILHSILLSLKHLHWEVIFKEVLNHSITQFSITEKSTLRMQMMRLHQHWVFKGNSCLHHQSSVSIEKTEIAYTVKEVLLSFKYPCKCSKQ